MTGYIDYSNLNEALQAMIENGGSGSNLKAVRTVNLVAPDDTGNVDTAYKIISKVEPDVLWNSEEYPLGVSEFTMVWNKEEYAQFIEDNPSFAQMPEGKIMVRTHKIINGSVPEIWQAIDSSEDGIFHAAYARLGAPNGEWGELSADNGNHVLHIEPLDPSAGLPDYPTGATIFAVEYDENDLSWYNALKLMPVSDYEEATGEKPSGKVTVTSFRNKTLLNQIVQIVDKIGEVATIGRYWVEEDGKWHGGANRNNGLDWNVKKVSGITPDLFGNVAIPDASDTAKGLVQVDGTTIVSNNGVISAVGGSEEAIGVTHITPLPPTANYNDYPNGTSIFAVEYDANNLEWYEALNLTPVADYEEIAGHKPSGKVAVTTFKGDNLLNQIVQVRDSYGDVATIGRYWTLFEKKWIGGANRKNSIDGNVKKVNGTLPDIHGNVTIGSLPPDPSLLPNASTTQKGIVQLTNDTTGTSEILAVTQKGIKDAVEVINTNITTITEQIQELEDGSFVKTVNEIEPIDGNVTIPSATTAIEGTVQLTSDVTGESEVLAVTQKAIKDAVTTINTSITEITEQVQELEESGFVKTVNEIEPVDGNVTIPDADYFTKGLVELTSNPVFNEDKAISSGAVAIIEDILNAHMISNADKSSVGHVRPDGTTIAISKDGVISVIGSTPDPDDLPKASITQEGIVQLTNESGESEVLALTQKAGQKYAEAISLLAVDLDEHEAIKASDTVLGHVKVDNVTITADEEGVISANIPANTINVVDNLISSSSTDALSAKQGKELSTMIDNVSTLLSRHAQTDIAEKDVLGHVMVDDVTITVDAKGVISAVVTEFDPEDLPKASTTQEGIVQLTNETSGISETLALTQKSGNTLASTITLLGTSLDEHVSSIASKTKLGHVMIDGETVTIDEEGIISVPKQPILSDELPVATSSTYGVVKYDDDTIKVNDSGQLYAPTSTPVKYKIEEEFFYGYVQEEETSTTIEAEIEGIENKTVKFYDTGMLISPKNYNYTYENGIITFIYTAIKGYPLDLMIVVTSVVSI